MIKGAHYILMSTDTFNLVMRKTTVSKTKLANVDYLSMELEIINIKNKETFKCLWLIEFNIRIAQKSFSVETQQYV